MNRPDIRRLPKRANPEEAQKLLLDSVREIVLPTESVSLGECVGRVLAEDVFSVLNIPDYDKTFIDGYAINPTETKAASTSTPAAFKIVGKLFPPDYPTALRVNRGEAAYVACGAPIPQGAKATVKVEETRLHGDVVEVIREIKAGEGIIPQGDDVKEGDLLLRKGHLLRPQDVGLLASNKMTTAQVFRKPVVSIISGGDELLKQTQKSPSVIANNYALVAAGFASQLGAEPKLMGIMPDALDKVTQKISQALDASDIVVTIGGSSVGVKDFVPDAINALGKPGVVMQGVSLRPGAISGFGIVNGKPVIMLPGHIGSCIAGFYLFLAPLIGVYTGLGADSAVPQVPAVLGKAVETGPQFRFLLVNVKRGDGKLEATPVQGGSSALTTIVKSNGYTIIPPHTRKEQGKGVTVTLFNKMEMLGFE
ncbi:MAG: molybdopterin molybdotransferase MoeA [Candidatus Bathyarchaeota archaeon]|nr:molybdopterin molybdotransferase MoeA [Candidatus Bathyarchaeota archaeon]